jgi:hypothetical protein
MPRRRGGRPARARGTAYRERAWDRPGARPFPLVAAALGAVAAAVGAAVHGLGFPIDVAGVLLVVGAAATALTRARPLRGALFMALLSAVVVTVLYGS